MTQAARDLALASLANSQYGVVSSGQLRDLGYSSATVSRYAATGRLQRIHTGVYTHGHRALSEHGRCLAAVLGCGERALASHAAAAWLWGIDARLAQRIDVTTPSRGHGQRGIRTHHSTILEDADIAKSERIPVTAVSRTLLDLAAVRSSKAIERNLERSERLGILDLGAIDDLLARCGGHAGRQRLRDSIGIYRQPGYFRSAYERKLRRILADAGLAMPSFNSFVGSDELDAYWPPLRFAVEVDAYSTHGSRQAFERDRARDQRLRLAGIEVARVTARQIDTQPDLVGTHLKERLQRREAELAALHPPHPPGDVAVFTTP